MPSQVEITPIAKDRATVEEIANEWGRSPQSIYRDIRLGNIPPGPAVRVGRSVFINRRKMAEWLDAGGSLATAAA